MQYLDSAFISCLLDSDLQEASRALLRARGVVVQFRDMQNPYFPQRVALETLIDRLGDVVRELEAERDRRQISLF